MLLHKDVEHDSRVRREARALREMGHLVTLVQLAPAPRNGTLDNGTALVSALPPAWVRRFAPFHAYRLVFLAFFVWRVLRERPDAVHAHDAAMLAPGFIGARLTRALLVYDSHELATGVPYRTKGWCLLVHALERLLIRRCDVVITVSPGIAAHLQDRYRLHRMPTVLRNVTELSLDGSVAPTESLRERLSLHNEQLILHLGAPARYRGCENLIASMSMLTAAHLVFLGDGEADFMAELRAVAVASAVTRRVHFLASVPLGSVLSYTTEADVGVSLLEGNCENHRLALPNKVFEYIAARVPLLTSDLPEVRQLVDHFGVGWTVDSGDPMSIVRGLAHALRHSADPTLRCRLEDAASSLTWRHEQERLRDAYSLLAVP